MKKDAAESPHKKRKSDEAEPMQAEKVSDEQKSEEGMEVDQENDSKSMDTDDQVMCNPFISLLFEHIAHFFYRYVDS